MCVLCVVCARERWAKMAVASEDSLPTLKVLLVGSSNVGKSACEFVFKPRLPRLPHVSALLGSHLFPWSFFPRSDLPGESGLEP